jgi:hypothetical protein
MNDEGAKHYAAIIDQVSHQLISYVGDGDRWLVGHY